MRPTAKPTVYSSGISANARKHQPETLAGLQPLYQAVVHGCLAGRQQEACVQVYLDRIQRGGEAFSIKKLGAIGSDLRAIVAFFETRWSRISPNLSESDQAWLLNEAAFSLRALGRLTEALEPMRVSGEMDVKVKEWKGAAVSASNLSELEVTLGQLPAAVGDGRRAGRSPGPLRRSRADAGGPNAAVPVSLLASGIPVWRPDPGTGGAGGLEGPAFCGLRQPAAGDSPGDAESTGAPAHLPQQAAAPQSGSGLPQSKGQALAACDEAHRRATQTLEWVTGKLGLLDVALDHLTLAQLLLLAVAKKLCLSKACEWLPLGLS